MQSGCRGKRCLGLQKWRKKCWFEWKEKFFPHQLAVQFLCWTGRGGLRENPVLSTRSEVRELHKYRMLFILDTAILRGANKISLKAFFVWR